SEDGDDDDDANGSLDEEVKAPPPASKTTKAPVKVPDSKAKDPKAPTTSTSGTRTRSGQRGGRGRSQGWSLFQEDQSCHQGEVEYTRRTVGPYLVLVAHLGLLSLPYFAP
ncbi:hypothetical protein L218DRAFT_992002, partial [Marasmius fiardii PR-910]